MRISPLDLIDDNGNIDTSFDNTCDLWWPEIACEQVVNITATIDLLIRRGVICEENGD